MGSVWYSKNSSAIIAQSFAADFSVFKYSYFFHS